MGEGAVKMTQIAITNAGGTLNCDAIEWGERQVCKVAVRPVPTRSSGSFIDTGTYTLKNRVITMTIRVSDTEKTTLQGIFNQSANCTITAGDWTYTAWLQTKNILWKFAMQNGIERNWETELKFKIATFSYSP